MNSIFVTGTDTGAGKTVFSGLLLRHLVEQNLVTAAYKPVAAGSELIGGQRVNDDAWAHYQVANAGQTYQQVNPWLLDAAIAPHIAAAQEGVSLSAADISKPFHQFDADVCVVEGAGGWLVPLNDSQTMADWVASEKLPVVLVVAMRLGCLNHALLTAAEIERSGCKLVGWVANQVSPDMPVYAENLSTLQQRISAPFWGEIQYFSSDQDIQHSLRFDRFDEVFG